MSLLFLENLFLYFPEKEFIGTPSDLQLEYQDVTFLSANQRKLHGWWIPHPQAKKTLLFFHGNAGNISHRLDKIKFLHAAGAAIFIFDYAGFGKSEGKPSEKILYEDGLAAYHHLTATQKMPQQQILFYGESIGCGVAMELAAHKPTSGLILEAAFTSLKAMAKAHFFFLVPFAGNQFNNLEKIQKIKVPKLFIHSEGDEIAPFEQAKRLFEAAPPPKQSLWFKTGGHNEAFLLNKEAYQKSLRDFLGKN